MFNNYLKIAFRNLLKRKGYFLLNVLGITIGMTSCLLIFHYVSYEKSYDEQVPSADNMYRLRLDSYQQGKLSWKSATVYPAIAPAMKQDFPEVENYCRLIDAEISFVNQENNVKFQETKGYFSDPAFIPMFGLELTSGNAATALRDPHTIIISESMAKKYFGNQDPIGKVLMFKNRERDRPTEVSGVFKDRSANSHLAIEYLMSMETYRAEMMSYGTNIENLFDRYDFYTYLQLKPGTNVQAFEAKFPAFCKKHMVVDLPNKTYDELHLIPVKDIHLKSNYNQEAEVNGNGQMVSFLFMIGLFIICIAWINYVNLSTARSVERAKEVGVKKVLGAFRSELIRQFMLENILLNTIGLMFSLCLFYFLLDPFDSFTGRDTATNISLSLSYWILFALVFVVGTVLSGLYPAFVLSAFHPIKVLKGAFKNTSKGTFLRKGLIIFQFTISVILIAGTIIVYQQVSFMRDQQLGMSIDQVLAVGGTNPVGDSAYKSTIQPFREELLQNPAIKGIASSTEVPGREIYSTNNVKRLEAGVDKYVTHYFIFANYDYVPVYSIRMLAGRNFSRDFPSDKINKVLINERSLHVLGFTTPEEAINKKIVIGAEDTATILGVMADYHHQGLQKAIDPILLDLKLGSRAYYSIKLDTKDLAGTIASIEKTWKAYFPEYPIEYFFLDDNFNQQYKTDALFGKVFGVFAVLAILIACSGLLGLSAYNVLQRSKEIGVRKVLGASTQNILVLLSKDFIWLIVVALVVAVPMGWYVLNMWLRDFAYRIDIHWWVFLLAGSLALLIACVTILLNAYKAVRENPVNSLRNE
ncbi:MAG: transporter permease [Bacteroidetes bacterium]|jgi:putative ABC transport system permease protein|nr:transporter permease [Bacteroidota bacterium]